MSKKKTIDVVFQSEIVVAKWKCEEKMQVQKFKKIVVTKCKCAKHKTQMHKLFKNPITKPKHVERKGKTLNLIIPI